MITTVEEMITILEKYVTEKGEEALYDKIIIGGTGSKISHIAEVPDDDSDNVFCKIIPVSEMKKYDGKWKPFEYRISEGQKLI